MRKTNSNPLRALPFAAALLLVLIAPSCRKSDVASEEPAVSAARIESLRSAIATSTGVDRSLVEYQAASKTFSVDKDGLIALADAQLRFPEGAGQPATGQRTQQKICPYVVTPARVATITYYVDSTVPAIWVATLDGAIANWNSANSLVFMKRVGGPAVTTTTTTITGTNNGTGKGKKNTTPITTTTTTTPSTATTVPAYDVLVTTMYDAATNVIAKAYYPDYYGNAGNRVTINTYYGTLSASERLFALTHELGHTLGFTHTNGTYGTLVNGTPETDPNSVMNSFVLPWNNFTPYDLLAVRTVYPK